MIPRLWARVYLSPAVIVLVVLGCALEVVVGDTQLLIPWISEGVTAARLRAIAPLVLLAGVLLGQYSGLRVYELAPSPVARRAAILWAVASVVVVFLPALATVGTDAFGATLRNHAVLALLGFVTTACAGPAIAVIACGLGIVFGMLTYGIQAVPMWLWRFYLEDEPGTGQTVTLVIASVITAFAFGIVRFRTPTIVGLSNWT